MEFTEEAAITLVRRLLIIYNHRECIQKTLNDEYRKDMSIINDLDNLVLDIYNQMLQDKKS
jgi:hypothetical protein